MSEKKDISQAEKALSTSNGTCFVIMPIGKSSEKHTELYWQNHFDKFLKPLIEQATNMATKRSEAVRGDLLTQIVMDLTTSTIVVADLTDKNPNVFWELGVRQSFRHGTIIIAEIGTEIPFDIGHNGTIYYYPEDHLKMLEFAEKFKAALQNCKTHPKDTDSTVLEIIGGRGSILQLIHKEESIRRLNALLFEVNINSKYFTNVVTTIKENEKLRKKQESKNEVVGKFSLPTERLHTASIELLISQNYLDESEGFYSQANSYYSVISRLNGQLPSWESFATSTEAWISENEAKFSGAIQNFKRLIENCRDQMISKKV